MTMLHTLIILIGTVQPMPDTAPVPVPPTQEFTAHLVNRQDYLRQLRRDCMSLSGATLVADDWARDRWRQSPDALRRQATQRELADAAATEPLDLARLERAVTDEAQEDARQRTDRAERKIAMLHRLALADQAIFARRFSYLPKKPGLSCELPPDGYPGSREAKDAAH